LKKLQFRTMACWKSIPDDLKRQVLDFSTPEDALRQRTTCKFFDRNFAVRLREVNLEVLRICERRKLCLRNAKSATIRGARGLDLLLRSDSSARERLETLRVTMCQHARIVDHKFPRLRTLTVDLSLSLTLHGDCVPCLDRLVVSAPHSVATLSGSFALNECILRGPRVDLTQTALFPQLTLLETDRPSARRVFDNAAPGLRAALPTLPQAEMEDELTLPLDHELSEAAVKLSEPAVKPPSIEMEEEEEECDSEHESLGNWSCDEEDQSEQEYPMSVSGSSLMSRPTSARTMASTCYQPDLSALLTVESPPVSPSGIPEWASVKSMAKSLTCTEQKKPAWSSDPQEPKSDLENEGDQTNPEPPAKSDTLSRDGFLAAFRDSDSDEDGNWVSLI